MAPMIFGRNALLRWGLTAIFTVWSLVPIVWLILNSFKSRLDIFAFPPKLFFSPNLDSYRHFLSLGEGTILPNLWNSVVIASLSTVLTIVAGCLAAYAFSRLTFNGRLPLLMSVLATRLLPPITAVIPLFLLMRDLRLLDTHLGLVIVYAAINVPFAIWILKSFFDTIPRELEESARVDGCTTLRALRHITLPLALPGVAATATFIFVLAWNEFTFAFIFTSINAKTMPVVIAETLGELQIYWQDMSALATLIALPGLLFAGFMQRFLVTGLTAGSVK
ncbi:MAG TPA: carbohydrate ABC transporter permease [Trueperaceae bacterium]